MDVNVCQQRDESFKINRLHVFPVSSGKPHDVLLAL